MNILVILGIALLCFGAGIKFYSHYVSGKIGSDNSVPTPAVAINDGVDYVPTRGFVVFAHHFATIAGAGPIVGPIMGYVFGYLPVVVWLIIGAVFFGAVHDYTAIFASVREKGKSMAEIAGKTLGRSGFLLFILFTLVMIILVTSAFLGAAATSLTSKWPLERLTLAPDQKLLRVVFEDGIAKGIIGGIASTSVIIITAISPLMGFLIYKRRMKVAVAYGMALAICILSIMIGFRQPVALNPKIWMLVLSVYAMFAAALPVWLLLQPRDFTNVQILYGGILVLLVSIIVSGAGGLTVGGTSFDWQAGLTHIGYLWPMMFIVIACGAISGFHALAGGGTTSKQVRSEQDVRKIGYNAMILEGVLATLVILTIAAGLSRADYMNIVWPETGGGNPILCFAVGVGTIVHRAIPFISVALGAVFGILMVEGFIVTTLDSAVRLNRYLFEELWNTLFHGKTPALMRKFWFNSGLSVVLMFLMAYFNAFAELWKIFGSANQLLASLTLMAVTIWLYLRGRKFFYTLIPAVFMLLTTLASLLFLLVHDYIPKNNWILIITDLTLLLLALAVAGLVIRTALRLYRERRAPIKATAHPTCG